MLYVDRILYSSVIYPANYGKKKKKIIGRERKGNKPTSLLLTKIKIKLKN